MMAAAAMLKLPSHLHAVTGPGVRVITKFMNCIYNSLHNRNNRYSVNYSLRIRNDEATPNHIELIVIYIYCNFQMGICMLFIDIHQCCKSITVGLNNWWTTTFLGEHTVMHVNTDN